MGKPKPKLQRASWFTPTEAHIERLRATFWEEFVLRLPSEACRWCKTIGQLRIVSRDDAPMADGTARLQAKTMCHKCGERQDWECSWK